MSEQPKNIHEAILAVMGQVGYVQKQRTQGLNYSYAGEAALIAALRPQMVECGIYMSVIEIKDIAQIQYTTAKGAQMFKTQLTVVVRFTHAPSMTFIDVMATGEGGDNGDKGFNKALTGAYKYALRETFMIETGDDPDQFSSKDMEAGEQQIGNGVPADNNALVQMVMTGKSVTRDEAVKRIGVAFGETGVKKVSEMSPEQWPTLRDALGL